MREHRVGGWERVWTLLAEPVSDTSTVRSPIELPVLSMNVAFVAPANSVTDDGLARPPELPVQQVGGREGQIAVRSRLEWSTFFVLLTRTQRHIRAHKGIPPIARATCSTCPRGTPDDRVTTTGTRFATVTVDGSLSETVPRAAIVTACTTGAIASGRPVTARVSVAAPAVH